MRTLMPMATCQAQPRLGALSMRRSILAFVALADSLRTAEFLRLLRGLRRRGRALSDLRKPVVGPRLVLIHDLRIKRAFWVCGLARILLISCVISSQRSARRGGGAHARADSLRTPKCLAQRGVDEMFALGWR